jgi:hypothetical protein
MDALATFRALIPEFAAKTDDEVNVILELAKPHVTVRFGSFYEQALAYHAAHLFAINTLVAEKGSTNAGLTAGEVISEKEGDLSISYAQQQTITKTDLMDKTYYGKEFKALAKKCIVPVMTRM